MGFFVANYILNSMDKLAEFLFLVWYIIQKCHWLSLSQDEISTRRYHISESFALFEWHVVLVPILQFSGIFLDVSLSFFDFPLVLLIFILLIIFGMKLAHQHMFIMILLGCFLLSFVLLFGLFVAFDFDDLLNFNLFNWVNWFNIAFNKLWVIVFEIFLPFVLCNSGHICRFASKSWLTLFFS